MYIVLLYISNKCYKYVHIYSSDLIGEPIRPNIMET